MKIQLRIKNEDGEKGKDLMKNIFRYRESASSRDYERSTEENHPTHSKKVGVQNSFFTGTIRGHDSGL